jgi:hypothetical protein
MARTIGIAAEALDEQSADEVVMWLDSEQAETLVRDSRADASLLVELDAFLPDTIADL